MTEKEIPTFDQLGWDAEWQAAADAWEDKNLVIGRVAVRYKGQYAIWTRDGEEAARIKGYLRYQADSFAELPVVGDWIGMTRKEHESLWRIHEILPRRTELRRKVKGTRTDAQVLAANVTHAIIVMALTEDYNVRRLERYLVLVHQSGATPIVVLNKADLLDDELLEECVEEIQEISRDVLVYPVSAKTGDGVDTLNQYFASGNTVVFLGSSGAGKSTLVNALVGNDIMETGAVRDKDGRGRHTTTRREMVTVPEGGIVIDSPGIREIQPWESDEGLDDAFDDIEELARQCRFSDCAHVNEPGCAVLAAIEEGELDPERLENYKRLAKEAKKIQERQRGKDEQAKAFRQMKKKRQGTFRKR